MEYNNVIRVTEKAKINLTTWWSINIVDIYIQDTLVDFYTFSYKTFSEGYKQHYDYYVKEILSEPTRSFPHTRVV